MTTKTTRERDSGRRARLGQYFLNMSLAAFVGMVIGGMSSLKDNGFQIADLWYVAFGTFSTWALAYIGNRIF